MSGDTSEKELVAEIEELRKLLYIKEAKLASLRCEKEIKQSYGLNNVEVNRYSRQIFLSEIGVKGQRKIKNSSVLIVGVGGLGCPAALYLAGAGVGHIGIVDYDDIELNNLHRQLLYTEASIGSPKVIAAAESIQRLNSNVKVTPYKVQINSDNALDIIEGYNIVIDATDNVATRYLLNDLCVLTRRPLVSGSALRFEGQLSVYNYRNGPCLRCIFPEPPSPETVTNCGDAGVLGAVVGVIGVLQALEALKIIFNACHVSSGKLLLFDGMNINFRNVYLREKKANCAVCAENPVIRELIDYEQFCGAKANDKEPNLNLLKDEERISVEEYRQMEIDFKPRVLIDVRSIEEYQICHLNNSINIPFDRLTKNSSLQHIRDIINMSMEDLCCSGGFDINLCVICRRGNDSQKAVQYLKTVLTDDNFRIIDIIGGIRAWSQRIDPQFPEY